MIEFMLLQILENQNENTRESSIRSSSQHLFYLHAVAPRYLCGAIYKVFLNSRFTWFKLISGAFVKKVPLVGAFVILF